MSQQVDTKAREAVVVENAASIRMMGFPILEALPSRTVPYEQVDPFILVHEGRMKLSEVGKVDTKHPHRGFDNLWYVIEGSASTGHTTGPNGAIERARLSEGALLALRTGQRRVARRGDRGRRDRARATATPSSAACCSG